MAASTSSTDVRILAPVLLLLAPPAAAVAVDLSGTLAGGGKPSTADGWLFAFGSTLEKLTFDVLGVKGRGTPGERWDRRAGTGYVAPFTANDYADAQAKGHGVPLLTCETPGAVSAVLDALLRHLGRLARAHGTVDHTLTQYDTTSRSAPRAFYDHHLSAVAAAVVYADATTCLNAAAVEAFQQTHAV